MTITNIEVEVLELVAKERGLVREKVELSARLLHDLGMDGDDAVDFFITIHERFGTDLTHLRERWSEHFGPEGFSCWNGVIIIPAALLGGLGAAALDLSAIWGVGAAIGLLALWVLAMRRWGPADRMVPITVADVVSAVEVGAWPGRD